MNPRLPIALLLCAAGAPALADEPPQATTLSPVQVHASDSAVIDTPSVKVHIDRKQLQQQNIVGSADVVRYAPNLQVRERYIGDPNATLGGRDSGTLQSARSLLYADGLLLSDLMDNGWDGAPRWGMVPAEEIGAVDVLYGPYSALYPGNAMGVTVLIHTRLPDKLIASVDSQYFSQDFGDRYGTSGHYDGHRLAGVLGDKQGRWRWLLSLNQLDNHGQPMQYATAQAGGNAAGAVPVDGATLDRNPNGTPRLVYGANTIEHTKQTQANLQLGVDITDHVNALFTLGWWHNDAFDATRSLIRNAAGQPVYTGSILADGQLWSLPASGLAPSSYDQTHVLYGAELDGRFDNDWRWEAVASRYDYQHDLQHDATTSSPSSAYGGPGSVADMGGSGWSTVDLRSSGPLGDANMLYAGAHLDRYVLDSHVQAASDWLGPADGAPISAYAGRTQTRALYLQDAWSFAQAWSLTAGLRWEQWRAYDGLLANAGSLLAYPARQRSDFSPKTSLNWDVADDWQLRLSFGKAVRYPTVEELFQGSISNGAIVNNNPNLQPERDWSTDLSLIRSLPQGHWRVSLYQDRVADTLYTQTDITLPVPVTSVQNIASVRTRGVEGELVLADVWMRGLDLSASAAWNQATTLRDWQYPAADGKDFPRIPRLRATLFADWRFAPSWNASLGVRRSGRQYSSLNNNDTLDTYGAVSSFTVLDAKLRWRFAPQWTASLGVDNLTNEHYWVYHPYAGRTWFGELRWEL
ncbi:TonB-dependent receptor [Rhodanobacter sp. DHB23]|uniref:TonB-dependent receptor n=1 Tax=Rhodanobacter sp. DHB23 TaxID=2775923 RepID=UPI00177B6674|nr:TonB-dependent receptor [Rhodanobacter sp. DHB23]MBD8871223.1 TonB-dependent receptor [Rhodanobacter sp. DHB23]